MTRKIQYMTSITLLAVIGMIMPAYADGILYTGSDSFEFGQQGAFDLIGKYQTNGAAIVGGGNIVLGAGDVANGMTIHNGDLLTGTVFVSDLKIRDPNATPIAGPFDADTPDQEFNEDLASTGTDIWRAWFGSSGFGLMIQLDPNNLAGPALQTLDQEFGPVGATFVGNQLWITAWSQNQVGTFDPGTNTFTPVFDTPTNAGCLAWDAESQILWVGLQGGNVTPYNLAGVPQGPSFQPFGGIAATIDGCAIIPTNEVTKTWTFTDYNWDPVCDTVIEDEICVDNDTDMNDVGFRPANINNPGDEVLADALPQDDNDKYVAFAQVHKEKFSNTNPGAFYALTTVEINFDLTKLTVWEDYEDCFDEQGLIKFVSKKDTRNVKVAVAAPNGDITELSDDIYDGIGGAITSIDDESAHIEITDASNLTAGSTVYVLVKFNDDLKGDPAAGDVFDEMCDNTEQVDSEVDGQFVSSINADAALRITTSP